MTQDVAEDVQGAAEDESSSVSGGTHPTLALRWHVKDGHARDEPVKDAVQDATQDATQGVAGGVLGAAEEGSAKALIVARAIFHRSPRFPWATREGRARQGRGAGRCGGRCGGRALGRGAGIGLWGPGTARLTRLATRHHRCRRRLCAAHAEMGAQLGSSAAFVSGCGQALPGVPRKAPLCLMLIEGDEPNFIQKGQILSEAE